MSSDAGMDHPSLPQIKVEVSGPYLKNVSWDMTLRLIWRSRMSPSEQRDDGQSHGSGIQGKTRHRSEELLPLWSKGFKKTLEQMCHPTGVPTCSKETADKVGGFTCHLG